MKDWHESRAAAAIVGAGVGRQPSALWVVGGESSSVQSLFVNNGFVACQNVLYHAWPTNGRGES